MTSGQGPYGDPAGQAGSSGEPDTAGQGSAQDQPPTGQSPYWQPPAGQQPPYDRPAAGGPPYGQSPYGQSPYGQSPYGPPPYGQQPFPGYGPAPYAPTGFGAPKPMERPVTVRAGIGLFVGSMVLSLVAQVITWLNRDTLTDPGAMPTLPGFEDLTDEEAAAAAEMSEAMAGTFGTAGLVIGLLSTAVFGLFVWFAWRGHNWARIVLWILAGLGIVFGLLGAGVSSAFGVPTLPVLTALGLFGLLFDAVAIVLLALRPSNEWYRYRGWLRATGQPG